MAGLRKGPGSHGRAKSRVSNDFSSTAGRRIRPERETMFGIEEGPSEVKQVVCLAPGPVPGPKCLLYRYLDRGGTRPVVALLRQPPFSKT
jgi:hypothetical protein